MVLTVREVAEKLRVHPRTITRWLGDGKFPGAFQTPGRWGKHEWKVPEEAVDAQRKFLSPGEQSEEEIKVDV